MYSIRRKLLSQNFLSSPQLVTRLVGSSSIGKNDLVLEIGPGKGIITQQLIQRAGHVVAVELDNHFYHHMQTHFGHYSNLTLYHNDFLTHRLPRFPYKVFANIPFAIEGKIIRYLIDAPNPPEDTYLVMQNELAYRLAAPYKDNQFSLLHKPWFEFSILHTFKRTDFTPPAHVDAVLLRFKKKAAPLLPLAEKVAYQRFVMLGFGQGQSVRQNLKRIYKNEKVDAVLQQLSISKHTKPSFITLEQWLRLYIQLVKTS